MKKYLIFLGPPGSGKGTQAKIIAEKYGFLYFGTGDFMRQEAQTGSELGQKFKKSFASGELVSDKLVDDFVRGKLTLTGEGQGIVFDGYPRTLTQAQGLCSALKIKPADILVINLEITFRDLVNRLATRMVCEDCGRIIFQARRDKIEKCQKCRGKLYFREDDKPEVIKKRFEVYEKQTAPLINYFTKMGVLINIDGRPAIEEVSGNIKKVLDEN